MTLSDTDTAHLWETFRAGGGAELVRGAVRLVLQELIEAEATEAIGAGRYERSDARVNERNGHRPRLLATQASDVELRGRPVSPGCPARTAELLERLGLTLTVDRGGRGNRTGHELPFL